MTTIALIGAPGSGKTTVGGLLAARLDVPFVDVDSLIEQRDGRMIREIFAEDGEATFRELERVETLSALLRDGVVSLGGGAPVTPAIAEALTGVTTIWLQVDAKHAAQRIGLGSGRPLLAGGGVRATLIKLMNERATVYASTSQHAVETSGREPDDIVDEICALVEGLR